MFKNVSEKLKSFLEVYVIVHVIVSILGGIICAITFLGSGKTGDYIVGIVCGLAGTISAIFGGVFSFFMISLCDLCSDVKEIKSDLKDLKDISVRTKESQSNNEQEELPDL